jgi:excisionase family DNA binding protein
MAIPLVPKEAMTTKAATEFEPLLDSEDAATMLKIHPRTLQRLARSGEISSVQIGKPWRFRASSLNAWLFQKLITRSDPSDEAQSLAGYKGILKTRKEERRGW